MESIIVSGAGPAGLATAISLQLAGHNVLVVEGRKYGDWGSREQVLGLSRENKAYLISLGLKSEDFAKVSQFSFYRANPDGSPNLKPTQLGYGMALRALTKPILSHNPEELVVIGQLQEKLLRRYMSLGGRIEFQTSITGLSNGMLDLENHRNGIIRETTYKWLINAEGAHSGILDLIKQRRVVEESWSTLFITGVKKDENAIYEMRLSLKPQGSEEFVSTFLISDGKYFSAGLDLRDKDFDKVDPEANPFQYLIDVGLRGDDVEKVKVSKIQITQSHLNQFYFPLQRLFVIGDAAHTVNPLIAYGINLALREAKHLSSLFSKHAALSENQIKAFEKRMNKNVESARKMNRRYMSQSRILTQGSAKITQPILTAMSKFLSCKNKLGE